jgi:hypothetical protein
VLGLENKVELKRPYRQGQPRTGWEIVEAGLPAPMSAIPQPFRPMPKIVMKAGRTGAKRALCVGIDRYPTAPLSGCVADAHMWANVFRGLGFDVQTLTDEQAVYAGLKDAIAVLVSSAKSGDILALQYSGHGTQIADESGDEATSGDEADEAICPFDFDSGALLVDDELGRLLSSVAVGVSLTLFIDCCHSGRINRFGMGAASGPAGAKPRFVHLTPAQRERFRQFRGARSLRLHGTSRESRPAGEVLFSACRSDEVAWESNGQGEFTVRAVRVLMDGINGLTNEAFVDRVQAAFGAEPKQHPELTCDVPLRKAPLLFGAVSIDGILGQLGPPAQSGDPRLASLLADGFDGLAAALRKR